MKFNSIIAAVSIFVLAMFPTITCAQDRPEYQTPFDSYVRVANKVFVYDQSLFSPYTGPDVSHWERIFTEEPDDSVYNRNRLGIVSLTPTQRAYVDVMFDPMTEHYEFRDIKSGKLIHRFSYYGGFSGAMLVNGQGALYVHSSPESLCTTGKETRKYTLNNGALIEMQQPLVYWVNVNSTTSADTTLFLAPKTTSSPVAILKKGTMVNVLTKEKGWLLIKTPLGLTGWVPGERETTTLTDLYNSCG